MLLCFTSPASEALVAVNCGFFNTDALVRVVLFLMDIVSLMSGGAGEWLLAREALEPVWCVFRELGGLVACSDMGIAWQRREFCM